MRPPPPGHPSALPSEGAPVSGAAQSALGNLPRRFMYGLGRGLDQISEMVMVTESGPHEGGESRIVFVNQAFVRHTGFAIDELVGHSPRVLHGARTDPDAVARIRRALAQRQAVRVDITYHTRTGQPYCVDVEVVPIADARGQVTHFLSLHRDITDRVEIDAALRDSEERFRGLTELSSDWYWESDENFRFTRFDGNLPERFVHARSLGRRPWELPALNMDAAAWATHRADLEAHRPFRNLEVQRVHADGGGEWVAISGEPMFDTEGHFRGYRGVGSYIGARKHAEDALQKANELLRVALENVPLGVVKVDADGTVSFYNRRFLELLKLPEALMQARPTALQVRAYQQQRGDVTPLELSDDRVMRELCDQGHSATREHVFVRKTPDGQILQIHTRMLDGGGWVRTYADLTEHLSAQEALRESEARFRSLTQLSTDWYWEQDEQYRYTRIEGRSVQQWYPEAYEGKTLWELPNHNLSEAEWAAFRALLERREEFRRFEVLRRWPDGRDYWIAVSGAPIFDANGVFRGYRGVGRDITKRKAAERDTLDRLAFSQRLTHNVPGMVYQMRMGADGGFSFPFISDGALEVFELSSRQIQGNANVLYARIHPDDRAVVRASALASADALSAWEVEYRVLLPVAGERWHTTRGRPERQTDGAVLWYGFTNDITEQRRSRDAMNQLLAQQQAILQAIPDILIEMDREGRYLSIHAPDESMLVMPVAEQLNRHVSEVLPPDAARVVLDALAQAAAHEVVAAREYALDIPGRGQHWFELSVSLKGGHGAQSSPDERFILLARNITERVTTARQLREANALLTGRTDLLEVTLSSLSQGVVMYEANGRAVFYNERFLQMMDLPASLMSRQPTLDEIVDYQFAQGAFPAGMSRKDVSSAYGYTVGGRYLVTPGQYLREAPGNRVLEVKTSTLPSGGWVRTYADVTDYVATQRALKQSEERLNLVLQGSNDGAWDWNLVTREVYFSQRWWAMLGYETDELPATPKLWLTLTHPLDSLRVSAEFDAVLADSSTSFELEFRMLHKQGHEITVLDRGYVSRDEQGRAVRLAGTLTDITARKQLELRLERSEARLSAFFEAIPDSVWLKDAEGRYVLANPVKARMYGRAVDQMLGKTEAELVPPAQAQGYRESDERALRTGESLVYEEEALMDGQRRVLEVVKRAVHDHGGQAFGVLGVARDITERKLAEAQIERLAFYDPLTHLCNRRLFQDRLEQAQAASVRNGQWAAVCFIDLDNFKDLNDTLGHDTGDQLLQQVGQRLQQVVREEDTVARLGGDEFVVLFEQLGTEADVAALYANNVGQKILSALNEPYRLSGALHHNTPSIGLTLFRDHDERVEDILKRADLAMYQSKSAGRNTVRFFDPNMQAVVMARSALERDLRQALAEEALALFYQPVVNTERRVTGYEALVRWKHPQRGMVSPAEFIPVAEQTGLILPIGGWVLRTACEQLAAWSHDPDKQGLTLAVNLSARQLRHAEFVPEVLGLLASTGAPPQRLKLELTESLLLHDIEETILKMQQLAERGICFALDDFGTGYSSLSYLKRLPLSQLKIDQSFVRDLLTDPNDAAIARTILQLAQSLDLDVVAEGVETEGQRQFLQLMGCKAFQGYLFGRPGPLE
ncbi:EAL domain-containing protein [Hydrogenophaga atypica]|uniref:EAL domain-containing protein n=1 Tax=Hydrogenophaga atypica TaxID=249409 RepID=A0ABW2QER1_9BURK